MKASFDGARRNLAISYNKLAEKINYGIALNNNDVKEEMDDLMSAIGGIVCMYDPNEETDCHDLSDEISLLEVRQSE
jgi:hypothetical protein